MKKKKKKKKPFHFSSSRLSTRPLRNCAIIFFFLQCEKVGFGGGYQQIGRIQSNAVFQSLVDAEELKSKVLKKNKNKNKKNLQLGNAILDGTHRQIPLRKWATFQVVKLLIKDE